MIMKLIKLLMLRNVDRDRSSEVVFYLLTSECSFNINTSARLSQLILPTILRARRSLFSDLRSICQRYSEVDCR